MRAGRLLLVAAVLLALAGCVPVAVHQSPAPSTSVTPVFASDEDALAAAEKAYAAYLRVSAAVTSDGGSSAGQIDSLVTAKQAVKEHSTAKYFFDRSLHTQGEPTFSSPKLQEISYGSSGAARLVFYTCVDATNVRIIDALGSDQTPSNRADKVALQVTMVSSHLQKSKLLIAESDTWSGSGICI